MRVLLFIRVLKFDIDFDSEDVSEDYFRIIKIQVNLFLERISKNFLRERKIEFFN